MTAIRRLVVEESIREFAIDESDCCRVEPVTDRARVRLGADTWPAVIARSNAEPISVMDNT